MSTYGGGGGTGNDVDTELPAPIAASDSIPNPADAPQVIAHIASWDGAAWRRRMLQGANTDLHDGSLPTFSVGSKNLIYAGNGVYFERERTAKVFKAIDALAIAAETTIWTPATGKKFRIMGFFLAVSVAGNVVLRDGTAGTVLVVAPGAAGAPMISPPMGNGILSAAANNVLTAQGPATATLSGFVFGTEE